MSEVRSYRDLVVWQKAMDLVAATYDLAKYLPRNEEYRLTSQLLRAVVSVPANIAEGHARASRREYAHFVSIARGSLAEVETLVEVAIRAGLVDEAHCGVATGLAAEVGRMLSSLHGKL